MKITFNQYFIATIKKRRLKKQVIPSQKIPRTTHERDTKLINRSERHWLQKSTEKDDNEIKMKENESILASELQEVDENFSNERAMSNKNIISPSTYKPGSSDTFYFDKAVQTNIVECFELTQILTTDESLIHFTGVTLDILKTITKCAENTANFNQCDWLNINKRIVLTCLDFTLVHAIRRN
ncbi:hypothetical protein FQR65_LT18382 [Abscondita terminalis]|nr:hypothetical protein FQR65_LT18382 [Abscondita terminalis]